MTSDPHSSPIKTPKQLIVVVVLAFVVPITLIVLISQLVTSGPKGGEGRADDNRVLERIQPVGTVVLAEATGPKGSLTGQQVYDQVCTTCHGPGIAGAPKVGDKAAWAARLAQGDKTLFQHAIAGFQGKGGMMPPKGGNTDLADVEVQRAVVFMANQSGGNLKEPPPPPATAATQTAAPTSPAPGAPTLTTPAAAPGGAPTVAAAPAAAAGKPDGKKVYETTCTVCHGAGIAGAPKFGDKAAWTPRLAQGINVLHQHALQGFQGKSGVMPPKGGNTALPDADVAAAVDYMAAAAK
jgi:cytochrome c5